MANELLKPILAILEVEVEKYINTKADELLDKGFESLKKAIPGTIDDVILETVKPAVKAEAKKAVLKLADKIDGIEG
jgi:hypothetical protein